MAKFTVKVKKMVSEYAYLHLDGPAEGEVIAEESGNDRKEGNRIRRKLAKQFSLERHAGRYVNYSDQIELSTNF